MRSGAKTCSRYTKPTCVNHIGFLKVITLQNVAHVEAVIDFGEDENIEEGLLDHGCLVTQ